MALSDDVLPVTIVVVEDHRDTRVLVADFLFRRGARVIAAEDADGGLRAVCEHNPHVVLTDIGLPRTDGFELLKQIRALDSENKKVPVVAMTAMGATVEREKAIAAGFRDILRKPFGPDELLRTLKAALA
jgi:DNA-binding response OmpR family regulator